jgi:hypothetical protein
MPSRSKADAKVKIKKLSDELGIETVVHDDLSLKGHDELIAELELQLEIKKSDELKTPEEIAEEEAYNNQLMISAINALSVALGEPEGDLSECNALQLNGIYDGQQTRIMVKLEGMHVDPESEDDNIKIQIDLLAELLEEEFDVSKLDTGGLNVILDKLKIALLSMINPPIVNSDDGKKFATCEFENISGCTVSICGQMVCAGDRVTITPNTTEQENRLLGAIKSGLLSECR